MGPLNLKNKFGGKVGAFSHPIINSFALLKTHNSRREQKLIICRGSLINRN
jgi:hypothetical protein